MRAVGSVDDAGGAMAIMVGEVLMPWHSGRVASVVEVWRAYAAGVIVAVMAAVTAAMALAEVLTTALKPVFAILAAAGGGCVAAVHGPGTVVLTALLVGNEALAGGTIARAGVGFAAASSLASDFCMAWRRRSTFCIHSRRATSNAKFRPLLLGDGFEADDGDVEGARALDGGEAGVLLVAGDFVDLACAFPFVFEGGVATTVRPEFVAGVGDLAFDLDFFLDFDLDLSDGGGVMRPPFTGLSVAVATGSLFGVAVPLADTDWAGAAG